MFVVACSKIVTSRNMLIDNFHSLSRPTTPSQTGLYRSVANSNNVTATSTIQSSNPLSNITNSKFRHIKSSPPNVSPTEPIKPNSIFNSATESNRLSKTIDEPKKVPVSMITVSKPAIAAKPKLTTTQNQTNVVTPIINSTTKKSILKSTSLKFPNDSQFKAPIQETSAKADTLVQTPNVIRKNRRKSNLFTPLSGKNKNLDDKYKNAEVGVGRTIPVCKLVS